MGKAAFYKAISIFLLAGLSATPSYGQEIRTHYASVIYDEEGQITKFNDISVAGYQSSVESGRVMTSHDEFREKLDGMVERVETILHLFPSDLNFRIVLLPTAEEVQGIYRAKYGVGARYVAFYAPRDKTMFVSVDDIDRYVLAHELAHVIVDNYFIHPPPAVIQEVVAQYVASHIDD